MTRRGRPSIVRRRPKALALRAARIRSGKTVNEVADAAGVRPQSIYDYELGRSTPDMETLRAIAALFGCTTQAFFRKPAFNSRRRHGAGEQI